MSNPDESVSSKTILLFSPEDDQGILIEMSSWKQRFFSEPPQLIYMELPQTFPYRFSKMFM